MVLIVVTVAIVMVSLAGLSFVAMMSTEHKAVYVHGDQLQLAGLVDSGKELLGAICELSPEDRREAGGLLDNPDVFRGKLVFEDPRAGRHGRFSVVSPNVENDEITGVRFGSPSIVPHAAGKGVEDFWKVSFEIVITLRQQLL